MKNVQIFQLNQSVHWYYVMLNGSFLLFLYSVILQYGVEHDMSDVALYLSHVKFLVFRPFFLNVLYNMKIMFLDRF